MQEENRQVPPEQPIVSPAAVVGPEVFQPPVSRKQDMYETVMLIFGIATIISLLTNQGVMLKISAAIFLGVAVFAIVRNAKDSRFAKQQSPQAEDFAINQPKKPRSLVKVLGITMLVLIALPVLGYGVLILIFIMFLSLGGGNMGT